MARGAKPGERRGGRAAGTPNKRTITKKLMGEYMQTPEGRVLIGEVVQQQQPRSQGKKAVEILDTLMNLTMGYVARYQPKPNADGQETNAVADAEQFKEYLGLATSCAKELAKYQSPTFKAIATQEVPPTPALPAGNVSNMMEARTQQDAAAAYIRLVRQDPKAA